MILLLAALAPQDAHFPVELGHRWVYATSLGTEMTVEVAEHRPKEGRWRLETRGLRPDDSWPAVEWEEISVGPRGIQTHGRGSKSAASKSGGFYDGSDGYWILKLPPEKGSRWPGHPRLNAHAGRSLLSLSTGSTIACLGAEQIALDGRWIDTVRTSWTNSVKEASWSGDAWYAPGVGPVQGRILIVTAERRREFTWTLQRFEIDPTREAHECPECGTLTLSGGECHDRPKRPSRSPLGREILERIGELGSESAETRGTAERRLREIGTPAHAALRRAAEGPDAEVRARARELLPK